MHPFITTVLYHACYGSHRFGFDRHASLSDFSCQIESTAPQLVFVMWHYFGQDHQGQGSVIKSRIKVTSNDCDFIFKFLPPMRTEIDVSRVDLVESTILSQTRAQ